MISTSSGFKCSIHAFISLTHADKASSSSIISPYNDLNLLVLWRWRYTVVRFTISEIACPLVHKDCDIFFEASAEIFMNTSKSSRLQKSMRRSRTRPNAINKSAQNKQRSKSSWDKAVPKCKGLHQEAK